MKIASDPVRGFIQQYSRSTDLDSGISLNNLVLRYRETRQPEDFALICNKTLGVITHYAKRITNPDFTQEDAYSHGFEVIHRLIDKWEPERKSTTPGYTGKLTSFLTLVHRSIHNEFDKFAYRSKQYRSYIHRHHDGSEEQQVEKSLDKLLTDLGPKAYEYLPSTQFKTNLDLAIQYSFPVDSLAFRIVQAISTYNTTRKKELAAIVGVTPSKLRRELKQMQAELQMRGILV